MSKHLESLESRRLLAGVAGADLSDHIELGRRGALVVAGTTHSDSITVKQVGARIRVAVDGTVKFFRADRVKSITVAGGKGDDTIATNTALGVSVNGGRGSDDITTGSGNDTVAGAAGNDTIQSGDGNDIDDGGDGDDSIVSGNGNDHCTGDLGDDHIDGGAGTNNLDGGDGNDTMTVSPHSHGSHLVGGLGDDTIDTNDDASSIVDAGGGNDHVHGRHHGQGAGIEFDDDHVDPNEDNGGANNGGGNNGGHGGDSQP